MRDEAPADERVLVLTPTGRDGPLVARILRCANIAADVCTGIEDICSRWSNQGADTIIIAEEALTAANSLSCLAEHLATQPVWSDMPVVLLTGGGKTTRYSARVVGILGAKGNVTVLERPLRTLTLLSAVRSALRARRRQYEVRRLLEETERGVRQRDQFLAMLGHELRNPLAAICTAIQVVNESGCDDLQLVSEQADIITRQSAHVRRLVDDLLDVARVTAGKITLDHQPVDLREIAGNALRTLHLASGMQRHEIAFDTPADPVTVSGDSVRLEQVATNLLSNAVRYTPEGGMIRLSVRRENQEAVLSVRDTGEGIAADVLPRIFEPFVQSDRPLARSKGGLGIGLTVVQSLVRMHGGTVNARSDGAGRGSEFTVRLPVTTAASEPVPEKQPHLNGSDSYRVLLIEDNVDARRAMQRLLRLWGHRVDTASDGAGGVEQALLLRPDVLLVDIGLPDIDGYEVARRIRAVLGDAVHLIALTGYGQPEDRRRSEQAGFNLHLVKPVDPGQLKRALVATPA